MKRRWSSKKCWRRRTGLPVMLWDERLTTVAADRAHDGSRISAEKIAKSMWIRLAAVFILQGYLDYLQIVRTQKVNRSKE